MTVMTAVQAEAVHFSGSHLQVVQDRDTGWDVVVTVAKAGAIAVPRRSVRGITEFGFVRQFRHTLHAVTLELPRGGVDDGESGAEGAARELLEETGCRADADRSRFLGTVWPDNGILRSAVEVHLFTVTDDSAPVEEDITTVWLQAGQIDAAIRAGEITCGMTLSAWALVLAHHAHYMP